MQGINVVFSWATSSRVGQMALGGVGASLFTKRLSTTHTMTDTAGSYYPVVLLKRGIHHRTCS